jgi:hypothetical protein
VFVLLLARYCHTISLAQCNSIIDIILLIVTKGSCRNAVQEANQEFSQNTHQLTNTVQTLKDEIIIELRQELGALREVRRSFELLPSIQE